MFIKLASIGFGEGVYFDLGATMWGTGSGWREVAELKTSFHSKQHDRNTVNYVNALQETLCGGAYDKISDIVLAYRERYKGRFDYTEIGVEADYFVEKGV